MAKEPLANGHAKDEDKDKDDAAITSDGSSTCSSDNDVPPPPLFGPAPPLPRPNKPTKSSFNGKRRRKLKEDSRNKRLAIQFRRGVTLVKYFRAWRENTKLTKQLLREAYRLMRRTWLLWQNVAATAALRRTSLQRLQVIHKRKTTRRSSSLLLQWQTFTLCSQLLNGALIAWRDHANVRSNIWKLKQRDAELLYRKSTLSSSLDQWRNETKISFHQRRSNRRRLVSVLRSWNQHYSQQRAQNEETIATCEQKRNRCHVKHGFDSLRGHARNFRLYRKALSKATQTQEWLMLRQGLVLWSLLTQTCAKYDVTNRLLLAVSSKAQKRKTLLSWSSVCVFFSRQELALKHKTLNRWRRFVEKRKRRRSDSNRALRFYAYNLCKRSIIQWQASVKTIREERKEAIKRSMHRVPLSAGTTLDRQLSSLRPSLYPSTRTSNIARTNLNPMGHFTTDSGICTRPTGNYFPSSRDSAPTTFNSTTCRFQRPSVAWQASELNFGFQSERLYEADCLLLPPFQSNNEDNSFGSVQIPRWIQDEIGDRRSSSDL